MGTLHAGIGVMILCMVFCAWQCMKEVADLWLQGEPLKIILHILAALYFIAVAFILGYCASHL